MQYRVPQFIEVEDKLFGALSLKQFIYVVGGGSLVYLWFVLLPAILALLPAVACGAFAGALAFYKFNGRPFVDVVEAAFYFAIHPRFYIWKQEEKKQVEEVQFQQVGTVRKGENNGEVGGSRLNDLTWQIDTHKESTDEVISIR
jgi:hypothetical protein